MTGIPPHASRRKPSEALQEALLSEWLVVPADDAMRSGVLRCSSLLTITGNMILQGFMLGRLPGPAMLRQFADRLDRIADRFEDMADLIEGSDE